MSRNTIKKYLALFSKHRLTCEEVKNLCDSDFGKLFGKESSPKPEPPERYNNLVSFLSQAEELLKAEETSLFPIWINYLSSYPNGYRLSQFHHHFSNWNKSNGLLFEKKSKWHVKNIASDDMLILKKWRNSNDRRKWEKALVLMEISQGNGIKNIAKRVERGDDKVKEWVKLFEKEGITSLLKKPRRNNEAQTDEIKIKKINLIKLIHETPKIHGINRASWSLESLSVAYGKTYGQSISCSTISEYIKAEGYSFRKAKETLTSPDPKYREKLKNITSILSNLGKNERFFSVDEYGPFSVKIKGGKSLVKNGELKTYPQRQKSKGFLICTAALELSTNQVSHFYSLKKNTEEMIKLLELLLVQYSDQERIFFSWDAASWHASKDLYSKIKEVNSSEYREIHKTPLVALAPLPSSAQFLNVIESVFSGLAKAIIHSSDYQSVEECKAAIDEYFAARNIHFIENPKRAGNKIWGKELVKPVFNEANNCKDPKWR